MNKIYEEKIYLPLIFILMTLGILGYLIYLFFFTIDLNQEQMPKVIVLFVMMVLLFTVFNFTRLDITMDENILRFRFGLFKREIYIKNIEKLGASKNSFMKFGGYGLRFSRDKVMGFVSGGGHGIEFIDKHQNKKYFLTTHNSDQLIALLLSYGAKKA